LIGCAAAQQQRRSKQKRQSSPNHGVSSFREKSVCSAPSAVLHPSAVRPQEHPEQQPEGDTEADGELRVGRNGAGARSAAYIAVVQPAADATGQRQCGGKQND